MTDFEHRDELLADRASEEQVAHDPGLAWRLMIHLAMSANRWQGQVQRELGVTASETRALLELWIVGSMSMAALGRQVLMSRPAITVLSDRLEERGLVKRIPDPSDRRQVLLVTTPLADRQLRKSCLVTQDRLREAGVVGGDGWPAFVHDAMLLKSAFADAAQLMRTMR